MSHCEDYEPQKLVYDLSSEIKQVPPALRKKILKLCVLHAQYVDLNSLVRDTLKDAMIREGMQNCIYLIETSTEIDASLPEYEEAISPPPAPSVWQRMKEKVRGAKQRPA